jgi:hypothetical protein
VCRKSVLVGSDSGLRQLRLLAALKLLAARGARELLWLLPPLVAAGELPMSPRMLRRRGLFGRFPPRPPFPVPFRARTPRGLGEWLSASSLKTWMME